jgi:hypothetical protein
VLIRNRARTKNANAHPSILGVRVI